MKLQINHMKKKVKLINFCTSKTRNIHSLKIVITISENHTCINQTLLMKCLIMLRIFMKEILNGQINHK